MATVESPGGALSSGAFRIAVAALAVFVIAASAIVFVLFRQSEVALQTEVLASLTSDGAAIERAFDTGGNAAVRQVLSARAAGDSNRLYLIISPSGEKVAGNIDDVPSEITNKPSGGVFTYRRSGTDPSSARQAVALVVTLSDGARVLVGRDIEAEQAMLVRLRLLALFGMGVLAAAGLIGGYVLSRAFMGRLESVNRTARSIMAGDLSRRVPVSGQGDEIDAVALNLNLMLDRIAQLMNGLREVSDNIAHDLKTPLNRLRNRAEAALRDNGNAETYRAGLEHTIEEADELIKTFNALLLIARLEAGALEGNVEQVDLDQLVGDVAELYEPVAEEAGLTLSFSGTGGVLIEVNRHLVGQAVANLIDNAIKYGRASPSASETGSVRRSATHVAVGVRRVGSGAEVSVADDGAGIGAEDRARVLKRFVRLEQSRSRPGTGLGLSLVAAVARLHGGTVRLEDNDPGLRVVLSLPAQSAQAG